MGHFCLIGRRIKTRPPWNYMDLKFGLDLFSSFSPHVTSLAATDRGRKISKQIICSSKTDCQKLNEGMEIWRDLIYFQSTVTPIQESSLRIRNMVIKLRNRVALNRANIQRRPLPLSLHAIYTWSTPSYAIRVWKRQKFGWASTYRVKAKTRCCEGEVVPSWLQSSVAPLQFTSTPLHRCSNCWASLPQRDALFCLGVYYQAQMFIWSVQTSTLLLQRLSTHLAAQGKSAHPK